MANKKFTQLPAVVSVVSADLAAIVQDVAGTPISRKVTMAQLAAFLASDSSFADLFVNVTGDTMTGPLTFQNGADTAFISLGVGGDLNISPDDNNHIVYINAGTADGTNTGQTITGRFRFAVPVPIVSAASVTVQSGTTGVGTALVRCSRLTPMTISIRKNNGTAGADWHKGNFCSFMQESTGQITLAPASANVILNYPASLSLKSREQYSVITATLYDITGDVETWVVSGDLEPAP
jgi:hypothetical protein